MEYRKARRERGLKRWAGEHELVGYKWGRLLLKAKFVGVFGRVEQ